jgi:hypothetical protein
MLMTPKRRKTTKCAQDQEIRKSSGKKSLRRGGWAEEKSMLARGSPPRRSPAEAGSEGNSTGCRTGSGAVGPGSLAPGSVGCGSGGCESRGESCESGDSGGNGELSSDHIFVVYAIPGRLAVAFPRCFTSYTSSTSFISGVLRFRPSCSEGSGNQRKQDFMMSRNRKASGLRHTGLL